jgi:hypothetical protein
MKILMLKTEKGSVDGVRAAMYHEGEKYDLSATFGHLELARAFVNADLAEEVAADSADPDHEPESPDTSEQKTMEPGEDVDPVTPEDRAMEPAENKRQKSIKGK